MNPNQCPECGSNEFVNNPNQYDILEFSLSDFVIIDTQSIDDVDKIFCRECSSEVNVPLSLEKKRIILLSSNK